MSVRSLHSSSSGGLGRDDTGGRSKIKKPDSGSVLLWSLLVSATILAASLALSRVVIKEIRTSRIMADAVFASYAAESGIEDALFRIRKREEAPGGLEGPSPGGWFETDAYFYRSEAGKEREISRGLAKDQTLQIDLFDPDLPLGQSQISSLRIFGAGDGWLEVGYTGWNADGEMADKETKRLYGSSDITQGILLAFSIPGMDPPAIAYRARFKALYDDISNLTIKAYSDIGGTNQIDIPTRLIIRSMGSFGQSKQGMEARLPVHSPLSGLYDYVLFTECSIVKGEGLVPTCPP